MSRAARSITGRSGPVPTSLTARRHRLRAALVAAVLCGAAGATAARAGELPVLAGPAMGTTYEVTLAAEIPGLPRPAVHREIERLIAEIDRAGSTWRPDADAARVNAAAAGAWIPVSGHLVTILEVAREIHDRSGGAFDVTAPGAAGNRPVGMRHVETRRSPPAVRTMVEGVAIDLGGIGPGYAVDVIGSRLAALGSAGHLVALGGEVRAWGTAGPGRPWRVRVTGVGPAGVAEDRVVDLADGVALGTASVRPGRAPVDPRTGRPVGGPPRSLTARADSCARADAWAVAAVVLALEPSTEGFVVAPAPAAEAVPNKASDAPRPPYNP